MNLILDSYFILFYRDVGIQEALIVNSYLLLLAIYSIYIIFFVIFKIDILQK